jgi:hypothetical protein
MHIAAVIVRLGVSRADRQRPIVAGDRLGETFQMFEGDAAIVVRLGVVAPDCERRAEARERLRQAVELLEGIAAIVAERGVLRREGKRPVIARERLPVLPAAIMQECEQMNRVDVVGRGAQHAAT